MAKPWLDMSGGSNSAEPLRMLAAQFAGRRLELPPDILRVSGATVPFLSNTHVVGSPEGTEILLTDPGPSQEFLVAAGQRNVVFERLEISAEGLPPSGLVKMLAIKNSTRCRVVNCDIAGPGATSQSFDRAVLPVGFYGSHKCEVDGCGIVGSDVAYNLELHYSHQNVVRRCQIELAGSDGIKLIASDQNLIEMCSISRCGQSAEHVRTNGNAIDLHGSQNRIRQVRAFDNQSTGIQLKQTYVDGPSHNNVIEDCESYDNGGNGFAILNSGGITNPPPMGNALCNVVARHNKHGGIRIGAEGYQRGDTIEFGLVWGTVVDRATLRSNGQAGLILAQHARATTIASTRLLGNSVAGIPNGYNMVIQGGQDHILRDVVLLGVDPEDQDLKSLDQIMDPAKQRCRPIFLHKDGTGTPGPFYPLSLRVENVQAYNHRVAAGDHLFDYREGAGESRVARVEDFGSVLMMT